MNGRSFLLALSLASCLGGCASYSSQYRDDIVYRDGSYYSPSRDGYGDYYYARQSSYDAYYDYGFAPPWGWTGLHCDFYRGYRCSPFGYYGYGYPGWSVGLYYGGGGYYYDPYGYDPYYDYYLPYGYWPPHHHHHHDDAPPLVHQPGPTPLPRPVYPGEKPPHPNKPSLPRQLQSLPVEDGTALSGDDGERSSDARSERERFRDNATSPRMRWRPFAAFARAPTADVAEPGEVAGDDDRVALDQDGNPLALPRGNGQPVRDRDPVGPARDRGSASGRAARADPEPPRFERRQERDDDAGDRRRNDDRPRPPQE